VSTGDVLGDAVHNVAYTYGVEEPRLIIRTGGQLRRTDEVLIDSVPGSNLSSSGVASHFSEGRAEIVVVVGRDPLDALLVTLHEMAHIIVPPLRDSLGRVRAHTQAFYHVAGEIYAVYEIPMGYSIWRESYNSKSSARIIKQRYAACSSGAA